MSSLPDKDALYVFLLSKEISLSLEPVYFDSLTQQEVSGDLLTEANLSARDREANVSLPDPGKVVDPGVRDMSYYKSDLHRYNLKRNANGRRPLTEEEFELLIEEQSIESLSGSDAESDNSDNGEQTEPDNTSKEQKLQSLMRKMDVSGEDGEDSEATVSFLNTRSPFINFKSSLLPPNKVFGLYKCFLADQEIDGYPLQAIQRLSGADSRKTSALLMIGGGHFAGAIISHVAKNIKGNAQNGKENRFEQKVDIVCSKSFHRYTTRRKQGGSQSASDNAHGKANSAGSSIRRHNEQALIKEVRELMQEWSGRLKNCVNVFIRANGPANRRILVGYEGAVLQNNDSRIKSFPFTTKRATTTELKRAWVELSYLNVMDIPKLSERAQKKLDLAKERAEAASTASAKSQPQAIEKNLSDILTSELIALLKKQKAPKLISFIKQNDLNPSSFLLTPELKHYNTPTMLHYAAANDLSHMIQVLLINLKADPITPNDSGKTAYQVASAEGKRVFRISRHKLGESAFDWTKSGVDSPKSKEEYDQEDAAENLRLATEKQQMIETELAKKTEIELRKPQYSSGGKLGSATPSIGLNSLAGLSDSQKMRIMREQRARAAEARLKSSQ